MHAGGNKQAQHKRTRVACSLRGMSATANAAQKGWPQRRHVTLSISQSVSSEGVLLLAAETQAPGRFLLQSPTYFPVLWTKLHSLPPVAIECICMRVVTAEIGRQRNVHHHALCVVLGAGPPPFHGRQGVTLSVCVCLLHACMMWLLQLH